ncbi:MAG: DNA polymerase I [Calditrichaeota bacterium]|nr:MAG: DNA polymerase I [Calditrichota bacterium]
MDMKTKRLFLIDGTAIFYRSYFVFLKNPLISPKGENVSGIYGFTQTLIKILQEEKPDYIAVVFDSKEPTFRHKKYPEYKATRDKMPEDMVEQYPRVQEVVKAFNIPVLEVDGYEADDVMGTLAKKAEKEGVEVYLVTGDKDFMQLLSPHVKMYNIRSGREVNIIDEDYVKQKMELSPQQVVDFLALMGDTSDNVPGVPKIGEKTAKTLLSTFGSLEAIYENLDKVTKASVQESLRNNRNLAELSRELVTIDVNVPVDVNLDDLRVKKYDRDKIISLFQEFGFKSLLQRLEEEGVTKATDYDEKKQKYTLINTPESLQELAKHLSKVDFFVFDTETTGLNTFSSDIIGIAVCWKPEEAYYIPISGIGKTLDETLVKETLKPIFENPAVRKGGQNIKFDGLMLHQHGIGLKGIDFDTMIASYLINPEGRQNNLTALAEKYLQYRMIPIEQLIGKKGKKQKSMEDVPVEMVYPYACEDADITYRLIEILQKKLKEVEMEDLFHRVEMPLVEVLLKMEINGVSLDVEFLNKMSKELEQEAHQLEQEIHQLSGVEFNINSPQQLGQVLFEKLKIHEELGIRRPKKTPTGQYATSEGVLVKYSAHPVVDKILEYRKLMKLKSTYVDALPRLISPRTGRVHTSFNQTITATGRLSSSDPNLQNIPIRDERGRTIRRAFIPANAEDFILSADYSQVELRMMAHLSGDPALKEAFERGEDIHTTTAAAIFNIDPGEVTPEHRRKAKEVNFGIIYGISSYGLASRLNITPDEAQQIITNYFVRFPEVNQYIIRIIAFAQRNGYVTTILNRRRYVPEINSRNTAVRQNAERIAINTTIQGSAADLIKLAMINIHQRMEKQKLQSKMILQVHDELVFEVAASEVKVMEELVREEMENAIQLNVPLKVDIGIGKNWLEAH